MTDDARTIAVLRRNVTRLRRTVLVLVVVVVFGAVLAPTVVIFAIGRVQQNTQTQINCTTLEAGVSVARTVQSNRVLLIRIARTLGLMIRVPPLVVIPEVPAECAET
jgi:hypothetical protein